MIRELRCFFLVGLVALAGVKAAAADPPLPLHAVALPSQPLPRAVGPISWPVAGQQAIPQVGRRIGLWDGQPIAYHTFTLPRLTLELRFSDFEDWTPVDERVRHGFEAAYRWNPRVRFGLTLSRPAVFLESLDTRPWMGYLAHLAQAPGRQLQANDDSARSPQLLRLMDARTRVLRYESPGTVDQPGEATIEVFAELPGYVAIFSLTGPAQEVDALVRPFRTLLLGFAVADS